MQKSVFTKALSCLLATVIAFSAFTAVANAASNGGGKYVGDVFVAYGEKKEDAEAWLTSNGWEPVCDLNDGKTSHATWADNAVAVLGIRRTSDPKEAVTDLATMNMKGGYSFDDYESLVKQKKADIDEFIHSFVPALNEYRANYKGEGSEGGQKRAQAAHDLLNKLFDGDPNGEYAVNDTGKPLGDLFLNKTKTEIGDEAYNVLSAEQKSNTADLQQIILESSGPAVLLVEQALALATDTGEDSWLQRLDGLDGADLVARIAEFAPEAAGQDLAPSAAMSILASHFEDYSKKLAAQWSSVRGEILWFEEFCEENGLWQSDYDDADAYTAKVKEFFGLSDPENAKYPSSDFSRFTRAAVYYYNLKEIAYSGEWGETLFDFFRPEDEEADYSEEFDYFAPLAAALSDGQRAALEFISLAALLRLGIDGDSIVDADLPSVSDAFKDSDGNEFESISVYSGINRAIFRRGVALTSTALMQKDMGKDPYEKFFDEGGLANALFISGISAGAVVMFIGACCTFEKLGQAIMRAVQSSTEVAATSAKGLEITLDPVRSMSDIDLFLDDFANVSDDVTSLSGEASQGTFNTAAFAGKILMGVGAALMIFAAAMKIAQLVKYYNRTFTIIPKMIVDEADIVSYTTDDKGNQVKLVNFDQFAYYEAVKCNRQEIGIHSDAQDGVAQYAEWGCGDVADINADVGKQWLALYLNRSAAKGDPILADSITLKTGKGSGTMPSGMSGCLHMFTQTNPVKIDNEEFCYRSDNEGMYLYWNSDASAFTASAFSGGGYIALAAVGGLLIGVLGATAVLFPRRKKETAAAKA